MMVPQGLLFLFSPWQPSKLLCKHKSAEELPSMKTFPHLQHKVVVLAVLGGESGQGAAWTWNTYSVNANTRLCSINLSPSVPSWGIFKDNPSSQGTLLEIYLSWYEFPVTCVISHLYIYLNAFPSYTLSDTSSVAFFILQYDHHKNSKLGIIISTVASVLWRCSSCQMVIVFAGSFWSIHSLRSPIPHFVLVNFFFFAYEFALSICTAQR